MNKNAYHIDVTPEEDALFRDIDEHSSPKIKWNGSKGTYIAVVGVHVLLLGIISCTGLLAKPSESKVETQVTKEIGSTNSEPIEKKEIKLPDSNNKEVVPKPALPATKAQQNKSTNLTRAYTVKQGDTLNSICRKFKLNYQRLIKINNIKDPNKIAVGQTLKFCN